MYLSQFDSIRFFYSCEHPLNFVFVCQSMSSLALELKARGITLVDPLEAAALKAKKAGVTFDDCKEDFDFDIAEQEEVAKSTPKKKKQRHQNNKSCRLLQQQQHQERKQPSKAHLSEAHLQLSTK
jgi:hypothetical protein